MVESRLQGTTNTSFRKLLTTLPMTHCSRDQVSGIQILSALLEKCSEGRPKVTNYFSGAPVSDDISPEKRDFVVNYGSKVSRRHVPISEPNQVHLPAATVSSAGDSDEDRSSSCGSSVSAGSVSSGQSSGPPP